MYKVVNSLVTAVVNKLVNEFFAAYIQYYFITVQAFYLVTDGLCQVCFTQTNTTVKLLRVKRCGARFFSKPFTGTAANPVTITFNKCFKGICLV